MNHVTDGFLKAAEKVLYHGTPSRETAARIRREGILTAAELRQRTGKSVGRTAWLGGSHHTGRTYLTTKKDVAWAYANPGKAHQRSLDEQARVEGGRASKAIVRKREGSIIEARIPDNLAGKMLRKNPEWIRHNRRLLDVALDPDGNYSAIKQFGISKEHVDVTMSAAIRHGKEHPYVGGQPIRNHGVSTSGTRSQLFKANPGLRQRVMTEARRLRAIHPRQMSAEVAATRIPASYIVGSAVRKALRVIK